MRKLLTVFTYRHEDYPRAKTMNRAIESSGLFDSVRHIDHGGSSKLRYPKAIVSFVFELVTFRPTHIFLHFRSHEILPFAIWGRQKVIFDEFVPLVSWLSDRKKINESSGLFRIVSRFWSFCLGRTLLVLEDTKANCEVTVALLGKSSAKVREIPVGADPAFATLPSMAHSSSTEPLRVLFYSSMLPLHGEKVVLEAFQALPPNVNLRLTVVGVGSEEMLRKWSALESTSLEIEVTGRIPHSEIVSLMGRTDIVLCGPFGAFPQSQRVITGKTFETMASGRVGIIGKNVESLSAFGSASVASLVEIGSPKSLVDSLVWCHKNRNELPNIGRQAKEFFEANYSDERLGQILRDSILSVER